MKLNVALPLNLIGSIFKLMLSTLKPLSLTVLFAKDNKLIKSLEVNEFSSVILGLVMVKLGFEIRESLISLTA